MTSQLETTKEYIEFLANLKEVIRSSQYNAVRAVNKELIKVYWIIGEGILLKQSQNIWGSKIFDKLSKDLSIEFPSIKGFSRSNLYNISQWYKFYKDIPNVQQLVGQIPWGHNILIINKIKDAEEAMWYIAQTIHNGWSRNVLWHHIDSKLYQRQVKVNKITNFRVTLPPLQSDLAEQMIKDPYKLQFICMDKKVRERDLEQALVKHITQFLLELGAGFAFVGSNIS